MATVSNTQAQRSRWRVSVILLGLTLANLFVYWQVRSFSLIELDDNYYITSNPHIQGGLTWANLLWALTDLKTAGLWQPLVWISFLLDVTLFGLEGGSFHLTNLFFHILNSLLVFLILWNMTSSSEQSLRRKSTHQWRSALVALLFAIHPQHVESVAWVSERKDVLSSFFGLCSLWLYLVYLRKYSWKMYALSLSLFLFSLLSKAMWITLPLLLLLLDYWPLRRMYFGVKALVLEKVPFLILTILVSAVTLVGQKGAMLGMDRVGALPRVKNVIFSYVRYLGKLFWPSDLAIFYPFESIASWKVYGSIGFLILLFVFAIRGARKAPWILVGWLWYFVTLIPVIGIIQVGDQAMADRFSYLPSIGVFIMVVWSIPTPLAQQVWRLSLFVAATGVLLTLLVLTKKQTEYWQNSQTVFEHALSVTRDNYIIHNNLGVYLEKQGKTQEATLHYTDSIKANKYYPDPHYNLGTMLLRQGRTQEAAYHLSEAIRLGPNHFLARYNFAILLTNQGKTTEAIELFQAAIRLNPDYVEARHNLALLLDRQGRTHEAIALYSEALRLNPSYEPSRNNLGIISARQRKEASAH